MAGDLSTLMEFAVELARGAGDVALGLYGPRLAADRKADMSPVTTADREAEQLCRDRLEARFPADGILGEEHGATRPEATRRWILDPIDGTRTFVHGVPLFGVLIALEDAGDAVLGVMHFPALHETVVAARGQGCYWNGVRCSASAVDRISDALVLTTDVELAEQEGRRPGWDALVGRAALARTWGDCYGHALVATGRAEVMVDPLLEIWDAAALAPVVTEAGGVFTDWNGQPGHLGLGGISTNVALDVEARRLLGVDTGGTPGVDPATPVAQ